MLILTYLKFNLVINYCKSINSNAKKSYSLSK